jgi:hypothetical protein
MKTEYLCLRLTFRVPFLGLLLIFQKQPIMQFHGSFPNKEVTQWFQQPHG